jgi:hypothetical protein
METHIFVLLKDADCCLLFPICVRYNLTCGPKDVKAFSGFQMKFFKVHAFELPNLKTFLLMETLKLLVAYYSAFVPMQNLMFYLT